MMTYSLMSQMSKFTFSEFNTQSMSQHNLYFCCGYVSGLVVPVLYRHLSLGVVLIILNKLFVWLFKLNVCNLCCGW